MESIPSDWDCTIKTYQARHGSPKFVSFETYTMCEHKIIVIKQQHNIVNYYYKGIRIASCRVNEFYHNQIIGFYNFRITGQESSSSISEPNSRGWLKIDNKYAEQTFRDKKLLIPAVWKHGDYFYQIHNIIPNHMLHINMYECFYGNEYGYDIDYIPIKLDWVTMRLQHLPEFFITFTNDNYILVSEDSVNDREVNYGSDEEAVKITRTIFPAMDDFYKLIEQTLPQPIWEEMLPHLLNPKE